MGFDVNVNVSVTVVVAVGAHVFGLKCHPVSGLDLRTGRPSGTTNPTTLTLTFTSTSTST
jgi:hypothetical protein